MSTADQSEQVPLSSRSKVTRRSLLVRSLAFGAALPAFSTLLAACGDDDDDTPAPAATEPPAPAATEPPAAAADPTATDVPADDDDDDEPEETPTPAAVPEATPTAPAPMDTGEEKVLIVRNRGEIVNLDVAYSAGNPDEVTYHNLYSRLVFPMPGEDELILDLAEQWEVNEEGTEFTFNLREGVQWHKGYGEVTSADVKWTLDRIRDPEIASRYAGEYANVDTITTDGDYTVHFTLMDPDPMFIMTVIGRTGYIMNQSAIEEKGENYSSDAVGSGPYIFEEWRRGEEATMVRNDGHWLFNPENNIDRVVFKFLVDDTVVELALRSGDIDLAYVETPESQLAVLENPNFKSNNQPAPRTYYVNFGPYNEQEDSPLADVNFRRALSLAIDRELVAESGMDGLGYPAHTIFNTHMFGYVDTVFDSFRYDPDEARRLVEESGYDGRTIEIICQTDPLAVDITTILQAFWADIGVNVEVAAIERALYFDRRNVRDFEMASGPIARQFAEHIIYPYLTSDGVPTPNASDYTGIDDLANELRPELDFDRRMELLIEIQNQVSDDVPTIPIVMPSLVLGYQQNVDIHFTTSIWFLPVWRMSVA